MDFGFANRTLQLLTQLLEFMDSHVCPAGPVLAEQAAQAAADPKTGLEDGRGGVSQDFPLTTLWSVARMLRLADGPDEVHERSLARSELKRYR
jgi:hypothetical protein